MRKLNLVGGLALISTLAAFTMAPARPAGPGAIEDMLRGMFKALDANDRAAVKDCIAGEDSRFPVLIYDQDLANKPVTCEGAKAAQKYLDSMFDAIAKDKVRVASKITKIHAECDAPTFGYATFEFTQAATVGNKTDTSSYRATALVSYASKENKWRIFHWHASASATADADTLKDTTSGIEHKPGK